MEIIKHGRVYNLSAFGREIECRCGACLKIVLDDLEMEHHKTSDMRGEAYTESFVCVICPECGKRVRIEHLPSEVVEYVNKPRGQVDFQFPTYHEMLSRLCREFGIPSSLNFDNAVIWLKKNRGCK